MLNVIENERQLFRFRFCSFSESIVEFCENYNPWNLKILIANINNMREDIVVFDAKIDNEIDRAEYKEVDKYIY